MSTLRKPYIGARMLEAWKFIASHDGCSKGDAARNLWYGGSPALNHLNSCYRVIDRLIAAGAVAADGSPRRYRLHALPITVKGEEFRP